MNFSEIANQFGTVESFKKGEYIFNLGDISQHVYFVIEGVLKAHYLTEEGKEFIKSFVLPNDTIASLQALDGDSCSFNLLCLKDTKVIKLAYQTIVEQSKTNIEIANSVIELLVAFGKKKEKREYELLCLDAQQRYQQLLQRNPNIYDFVTQNDIARYLGVTPVALSRIKNAIYS
ncbi:Crp/Fnr family transcriptional regulator [Pseudoalteromonas sp. C2R02]|uniref:Crp/Fnr family transcriptional regulator n=1 Tax=Pseudoalteromonas sp. C2R02 TaxID=2841565 RepID=UPI001C08E3D6|nr:Crp/Fnr family transcriptional regulator [Pseudoalteromonas sp. C2R02]MBU2968233.1 Crp/Fnr family transcriptional regulator [Pseudoalteromonas sp. C2R02]